MVMFCKYITPYLGSPLHHPVATLSPSFPRTVLLKLSLLSTSIVGNDRATGYPGTKNTRALSDFLLKECGMCQSQISTILERAPSAVGTKPTQTAQQVVRFLRDSGFTEHQVRKVITRNPNVLTLHADRQLKPKIGLMKTLGFTSQEFGNAISQQPRLLNSSLENTMLPIVRYLQNLFGSEADICKVLKGAPAILVYSNGPDVFDKRMKHLASFGLLEDEIKQLVRRKPITLLIPTDKVRKIMDFFIHTAGLPAKFILSHANLLNYSLEGRIKPRYKVFKSISAMQPSKRLPSFTFGLLLSERRFLEKYVECSPHATKLLEIYSGRSVDLDIIK